MEDDKTKRAKRNQDLIERMKKGESLALIDVMATRFPPRPIIKKMKDTQTTSYKVKNDNTDGTPKNLEV